VRRFLALSGHDHSGQQGGVIHHGKLLAGHALRVRCPQSGVKPRRGMRNRPSVEALLNDTYNSEASMETYDPQKSKTEVRQASPRKMNSRVLVISFVAVVLIFAVLLIVFNITQPGDI